MRQNELDFMQNKKLNSHIKEKKKSDSLVDQVCLWYMNTGRQAHGELDFSLRWLCVHHFDLYNYTDSFLVWYFALWILN